MITELTQAQKDAIPTYVDKWIKIGINTDRLNYDETVDICQAVQKELLGRPVTPVVIFDNPVEAWIACNYAVQGTPPNDLRKKVDEYFEGKKIKLEKYTSPYLTGSFSTAIFSFYDYFKNELGIDYGSVTDKYNIWQSTSKLGFIFPLPSVCIVSEKPTRISLNEERVVHCDGAPAIEYAGRGGIKIYMLNGVTVPDWLALTHSSKIDLTKYGSISNADVKLEFVRKVGIERMLDMGKKIDSYEKYKEEWWTKSEYELWDMHTLYPNVPYAPHLKMKNQTTHVWHVEAVSPSCRSLKDAIAERLGGLDGEIKAIA